MWRLFGVCLLLLPAEAEEEAREDPQDPVPPRPHGRDELPGSVLFPDDGESFFCEVDPHHVDEVHDLDEHEDDGDACHEHRKDSFPSVLHDVVCC